MTLTPDVPSWGGETVYVDYSGALQRAQIDTQEI